MGYVKQHAIADEDRLHIVHFAKRMLERDEFSGALLGISKQLISKGWDSLSDKQQNIFDNFVDKYSERNICQGCSNSNLTELTDLIDVEDEGLCPTCAYDRARSMED